MNEISICLFLLENIWFTIYYYLNVFLYMFKIFQLTEQNTYVQASYGNPMFLYTFYINDMDNSLGPIHDFFFEQCRRHNSF